jgi:rhodanese-related sulfurtransferase
MTTGIGPGRPTLETKPRTGIDGPNLCLDWPMPTPIDRDEVARLLAEDAQLVEVLPADDYADEHLPGAINIPLKELGEETTRRLDVKRPVIVYCYDYQ